MRLILILATLLSLACGLVFMTLLPLLPRPWLMPTPLDASEALILGLFTLAWVTPFVFLVAPIPAWMAEGRGRRGAVLAWLALGPALVGVLGLAYLLFDWFG